MSVRNDFDGGPIEGPWQLPFLIQRLEVPYEVPEGHFLKGKDNPFSFGGGFLNGGFSKEAMDAFRPIFRFDYMGSAEYEFGAAPKAIQSIVKSLADVTTSTFEVSFKDLHFREWDVRNFKEPDRKAKKTVYMIAHKDHHEAAQKYVRSLMKVPAPAMKGDTRFRTSLLEPKNEKETWLVETKGWLDLDNCLFFFIDEKMFQGVWALFSGRPAEKVN